MPDLSGIPRSVHSCRCAARLRATARAVAVSRLLSRNVPLVEFRSVTLASPSATSMRQWVRETSAPSSSRVLGGARPMVSEPAGTGHAAHRGFRFKDHQMMLGLRSRLAQRIGRPQVKRRLDVVIRIGVGRAGRLQCGNAQAISGSAAAAAPSARWNSAATELRVRRGAICLADAPTGQARSGMRCGRASSGSSARQVEQAGGHLIGQDPLLVAGEGRQVIAELHRHVQQRPVRQRT